MPIQRAKDYYTGKGGRGRFNCAQAIIKAFSGHFKLDDKLVADFAAHGSGNAPGGVCGAYYAAKHLLAKHHPEKMAEFDKFFLEKSGSLKCDEIRRSKKLSCLGCIERSAEFLSKS